ncbi:hypothetical protein EUX98_g6962 [Antrodiella citrinella]|uniref:Uncharacterized protein n=1 Tax=Antrodiella citrinella TaxID=2447956 RepID=A0A4S4MMX3_9APHY|nr:hypothetical protein EUX98_g6962 [Antrodiella citrinella]
MTTLDTSAPLATLLRRSTASAHDEASNSQGAGWLTRGELDKEEYIRFLMMLYHIYEHCHRLENGDGLSFYEFRQLGGNGSAIIGDMKKIKEWFREDMNAGADDDQAIKLAIADEATIAFDLNSALFTILRPPTNLLDVSLAPASPPLGEPSTPFEDSPLKAQQDVSATPTYRVATVLAVIAALSLSHFLLVVNGHTGEKGATKLEAVQHWFANAFTSLSSA